MAIDKVSSKSIYLHYLKLKDMIHDIVIGNMVSLSNGVYCTNRENLPEKISKTSEQFTIEFDDIPDRKDFKSKNDEDITLFLYKTGIDNDFYLKNKNLNHLILQRNSSLIYKGDFSFFKDKVVVDAGCGNGRYSEIVAPYCRQLICLDVGNHIFKTKERLKKFSNVSFIQTNLENIPLLENTIDFVFSIGVIHHTPNPEKTLAELSRILKPNCKISIWVYPPSYWGNPIKSLVSKIIRKILLRKDLESQVNLIKKYLLPIGKLQVNLEKRGLKYVFFPLYILNVPRHEDENEMLATTIDYYLPQYIFTYSDSQLKLLFDNCGLSYSKLPFPTSAMGKK